MKILHILGEIFEKFKVINSIYIFGSSCDGFYRKGSDIDIGILFFEEIDKFKAFSLGLEVGELLERKIKNKVDLVVLNICPLYIAFQVIKGKLLFEREGEKRALFESRILVKYYHNKFFLKPHFDELLKRIKEK